MKKTQKYYNENAITYYEKRKNTIISEQIKFFLKRIKKNELILDLGCGSGNNLFEIKRKGYNIFGVDFSDELINIVFNETNEKIFKLDFSDVLKLNEFIIKHEVKHIFASASLLHLPKTKLEIFFNLIRFDGLFFFSLKEGFGEEFDKDNRFFSYYQKDEIIKLITRRFQIIDFYSSQDTLGRKNNWLNWIIK